jgi:hypothetical protein
LGTAAVLGNSREGYEAVNGRRNGQKRKQSPARGSRRETMRHRPWSASVGCFPDRWIPARAHMHTARTRRQPAVNRPLLVSLSVLVRCLVPPACLRISPCNQYPSASRYGLAPTRAPRGRRAPRGQTLKATDYVTKWNMPCKPFTLGCIIDTGSQPASQPAGRDAAFSSSTHREWDQCPALRNTHTHTHGDEPAPALGLRGQGGSRPTTVRTGRYCTFDP